MKGNDFVRVFQPSGVVEIAQAKMAMVGSGIPYYMENEHFLTAQGMPFSLGAMEVFVLVPEDRAVEARELLQDWFG